jgi:hypothetical protein
VEIQNLPVFLDDFDKVHERAMRVTLRQHAPI